MPETPRTRAFAPTSKIYHVGMRPGFPVLNHTLCGLYAVNLQRGTPGETHPRKLCKNCERIWRRFWRMEDA